MVTEISRNSHLSDKVVFVDGLPGCGKTLFSTLISSMDRVELLSYSYEIEHICALHYLNRVPIDAAKAIVNIQVDLKLYNHMMGRDVNFRPTDLSSVFNYHNPSQYIQRLSNPGDKAVPETIQKQRPILNLSVHNLLGYSTPLWQALGDRCVFIEIVRHPLYMIKQQALNMENLIGDARDFTIYYDYNGQELPYYINGWEECFLNSNSMERTVHFIDHLTRRANELRNQLQKKFQAKILTIPFEDFTTNPEPWMREIADILETNISDETRRVMTEQNVPRDMVANGRDLDIYRRCGWAPPELGSSERMELDVRREYCKKQINKETMTTLDRLSKEYEEEYWSSVL